MLKKVDAGFNNRKIIENNSEFMILHKVLMSEDINNCDIVNIE
jgi:hypothetical protein